MEVMTTIAKLDMTTISQGDMATIVLIVFGTLLFYFCKSWDLKSRQLDKIPGPRIWPLIGNLDFMERRLGAWNMLFDMAQKYGPVMRVQVGSIPIVILNSRDAIYNGLVSQGKKLMTRPLLPRIGMATPGYNGVIFSSSNEQWKVLRRAFLHNFKYYGSGKSHMEPIILDVFQDFVNELKSTNGKAIDPRPIIYRYFSSIMCVLNFGKRPTLEEFDLISAYDQELIQYLNPFGDGVEVDMRPWLLKLGLFKSVSNGLSKVAESGKKIWDLEGANTEVHPDLPVFNYEDGKITEPCFAATLKALVAANKEKGFGVQHARGTVVDTFTGGVSTSTVGIYFFFNLMAHHPEIQEKIQEEVDRVLHMHDDAAITNDMKEEMPYLQATVYELLRYSTILPFGLPHLTEEDVTIEGHLIPSGTPILTNTWFLHHSDHWIEPFKFKPERFLDEEGKFISADHPNRVQFLPFGAGMRVCAGKTLALNRYFITIGSLMREISVKPDTEIGLQSCDPRDGIPGVFMHAKPYTVKFEPRK